MKGVFKILIDGDIVFDKARLGRLPNTDEVPRLVEDRLGAKLQWRKSDRG